MNRISASEILSGFINQSIIVWTLKTKSLLPSLYKREEFPLFGKEGSGEIFTTICLFNYGLLCNFSKLSLLPPKR
jgi:acyl CoA:acetate/3-ketoacid CoA transferase beta subunit